MDKETRYRQNLTKLAQIIPQAAAVIEQADASHYLIESARSGSENLVREAGGKRIAYHSSYDPEKEATTWFSQFNLERSKVLYVYGIGLGYSFDAAKAWLAEDPGHYLVYLEDDPAVLRRFLETERAGELIEHKQVQLHYFASVPEAEPMIEWLTWYFIRLQPEVGALGLYERERDGVYAELQRSILHCAVNKEALGSEYERFGASFFRNYYANLLELADSVHGNKLFGQFKDVPAIICGAGPSLSKNIDLLPELREKALIITGGSALNALSYRGILPHFGGGIDPNPPQYERLMTNFAYDVPFFYRPRMYHRAFRAIHGRRLFLNGTGGYPISDYFEEKLGIEGEQVDEGMNIINLLLEVAAKLGCNPIVMVGMDLAFTGMKNYADGVVANNEVEEEQIKSVADLESGAFVRPDINGEPVYTLWKWVGESQWVSDFARRYPDRTVINATEGGLGFAGIPNVPLADVAKTHMVQTSDLDARVHAAIENATFSGVTKERVLEQMETIYNEVAATHEQCDEYLDEVTRLQEKVKKSKVVSNQIQTDRAQELDRAIPKSDAYRYIFAMLHFVNQKVLERKRNQLKHDWNLRSDRERRMEEIRLNAEHAIFIRNAAATNKAIMEEALEDYRERGGNTGRFFTVKEEAQV